MENELSFIWENCPIGLARVARDGKFISVNPRLCEITSYTKTELLSRTWQSITHPDDLAPDVTEAEAVANGENGDTYQMVKQYIRKDGWPVLVQIHVFAVFDDGRRFQHYFTFVTALTPIIHAGNSPGKEERIRTFVSLGRWVKTNPKEFAIVVAVVIIILFGKFELLQHLIK